MFSTFPNRATELSRGRAFAPYVPEIQRTIKYANLLLQIGK